MTKKFHHYPKVLSKIKHRYLQPTTVQQLKKNFTRRAELLKIKKVIKINEKESNEENSTLTTN